MEVVEVVEVVLDLEDVGDVEAEVGVVEANDI